MFKRRKDASYCYDVDQLMRIYPYIFKRRCDSLVFYEMDYDITNLVKFVKEYNARVRKHNLENENKKHILKTSTAIMIAFARILTIRPKINRFIKNKKTWQRNEVSESIVVKQSLDENSPELTEQLIFKPFATFEENVEMLETFIENCQSEDISLATENEIALSRLFKFVPSFIITFILSLCNLKDRFFGLGKLFHKIDCLHSSVFIANLSSLGIAGTAPHHHLYEWGTTSIFSILGPVKRERFTDENGNKCHKDTIKISFTVDERICDGFYFVKTLMTISEFLQDPQKIVHTPSEDEIPHLMTKKEYKAKLKELKRLKKERRKSK